MSQSASFLEDLLATQQHKKSAGEVERIRGNEFYAQGKFDEAIWSYTLAIEIYPVDPASYSNRAMVNLKLENYDAVIEDATKALDIDADYVKAYHRRGKALMALKEYKKAQADFQSCINRKIKDKEIMHCMAEVCEQIELQKEIALEEQLEREEKDTIASSEKELNREMQQANDRTLQLEKQIAEIDAKRDRLIKEAQKALEVV